MFPKKNPGEQKGCGVLNVKHEKTFEMIRKRAYELYCKKGYKNGNDRSDWFEAEKQVKRELGLPR